jgi:signal transduction histidine kinase
MDTHGRGPNRELSANGALGETSETSETSETMIANPADPGSSTARNGAERPVDDDEAQLSDSEPGPAAPPFAEDGMLLVDPETHAVIEIRLEVEQGPAPPAQRRAVRNGHEVVTTITPHDGPLRQTRLQVEALALANRRKDEFLAILSHELRGPLASIHNAARVLRSQTSALATQRQMQALIERQVGRMTRLLEELLDVSRITSGHLHLQKERLDLRDVVSQSVETLEWDLRERNHRLAIELPDVPVWVEADAARLEQVFINLLANASRYTDAGGQLAVWVHTRERQAIIRVRDTGIGIAPEAMPHIFDLFRQGNAADPRSRVGLGVGLAVVRNLVERHGGSVTVASAGVGQGSEFTVRLPTAE